jgi:hypothetical protein
MLFIAGIAGKRYLMQANFFADTKIKCRQAQRARQNRKCEF